MSYDLIYEFKFRAKIALKMRTSGIEIEDRQTKFQMKKCNYLKVVQTTLLEKNTRLFIYFHYLATVLRCVLFSSHLPSKYLVYILYL